MFKAEFHPVEHPTLAAVIEGGSCHFGGGSVLLNIETSKVLLERIREQGLNAVLEASPVIESINDVDNFSEDDDVRYIKIEQTDRDAQFNFYIAKRSEDEYLITGSYDGRNPRGLFGSAVHTAAEIIEVLEAAVSLN